MILSSGSFISILSGIVKLTVCMAYFLGYKSFFKGDGSIAA
jgi:hypothetical protein